MCIVIHMWAWKALVYIYIRKYCFGIDNCYGSKSSFLIVDLEIFSLLLTTILFPLILQVNRFLPSLRKWRSNYHLGKVIGHPPKWYSFMSPCLVVWSFRFFKAFRHGDHAWLAHAFPVIIRKHWKHLAKHIYTYVPLEN